MLADYTTRFFYFRHMMWLLLFLIYLIYEFWESTVERPVVILLP